MKNNVTIISIGSRYIVEFIARHPVKWLDRELSRRGSVGDQAGITPTPAVLEFMNLLYLQGGELFVQAEYARWCISQWSEWFAKLAPALQVGVTAKLYNNFYVSMIDSLHVWAMLSELGWFDRCTLDAYEDAIGKSDLTMYRDGRVFKLALGGPTPRAREDRIYKLNHRNNGATNKVGAIELEFFMDLDRARSPGNKRWFTLSDFERLAIPSTQRLAA